VPIRKTAGLRQNVDQRCTNYATCSLR